MFNCRPGVIVADRLHSPASYGFSASDERYTRIFQWSDAAFLDYKDFCHDNDLEWVVQATVINDDTKKMVKMALRASGITTMPLWESRHTFRPHTDPFYAILGSKNGAGTAYLLAQHKTADVGLGVKEISEITIWAPIAWDISNPGADLILDSFNMLFHITPVPL